VALLSDPVVMEFSDQGPLTNSQINQWLNKNINTGTKSHPFGNWAIELKSDGATIGYLKLMDDPSRTVKGEFELGVRLAKQYWGYGYASEAAVEMTKDAFLDPAVRRIIGIVDPGNSRSMRLLKNIGMAFEREIEFEGYDYPDFLFAMDRTPKAELT